MSIRTNSTLERESKSLTAVFGFWKIASFSKSLKIFVLSKGNKVAKLLKTFASFLEHANDSVRQPSDV